MGRSPPLVDVPSFTAAGGDWLALVLPLGYDFDRRTRPKRQLRPALPRLEARIKKLPALESPAMRRIAAGLLIVVALPLWVAPKTETAGRTAASVPTAAEEWTRFRGPNGTGLSAAKGIPSEWTEEDYNWNATLPGQGHSSPVVWGDKVFVLSASAESAERIVMCLDTATGKTVWERRYPSHVHDKHLKNSFASATPALDRDHVYCSWSTPEQYTLLALGHDGREAWRVDLGPVVSQHSTGVSPIVFEDMVILANDQDGPLQRESRTRASAF